MPPVVVVHEPHIDIVNIVSIILIVFFLAMLVDEFVAMSGLPAGLQILKKREGVPEMGTKPLKALRGYRASNRGSKNLKSRL